MKFWMGIRLYKKYIFLFFLIYLFMILSFFFTSIGTQPYRLFLHMRQYIPAAFFATLGIYFWHKAGGSWPRLIPFVIVGLGWTLTHNLLSYAAFHAVTTNLNNYKDIAFSGYVFGFLTFLRVLTGCVVKNKETVISVLFSCLQVLFLLIPLTEIIYFKIYGTVISTTAAIAFLQTNPHEAWEYIMLNLGVPGLAGMLCILFLLWGILFVLNSKKRMGRQPEALSSKACSIIFIIVLGSGFYLSHLFTETGVMEAMTRAKAYLTESYKFEDFHAKNFQNLQVTRSPKKFAKPSTIILIIGESAGRNFMSAYGYQANDTTPWWRQSVADDSYHFLRFNHAYSSFGSTVQALERALTEKNQYNQKKFSESLTILDLAKKAGYKTYWFSNQSVKDAADTPIQLVARTADVHEWIDELPENKGKTLYDGDLLPCLRNVNSEENNFVVIHVMGSHELTMHRYPPEFAHFSQPGQFDLVANYEDSMAYDDWVIQQIFTYAKEKLNLQAMIYFSDHGANPYRKRTADNVPFVNLRIPLLIYLSDEYDSLYPETVQTLRNHENQYFTNDLLYELVGGILQLKSTHIPEKNNFAVPEYQFTRDTLKTDLGRKNIRDDVDENKIEK